MIAGMSPCRICFTLLFLIVAMSLSPCCGKWGQADPDIAQLPLEKLVSTSELCNLTSKGRELQVMESREYFDDLAVRRLKVSASILKDESEKTVLELLRVIELEEQQKSGGIELNKKLRVWLEQNCVAGSALYLYSRHTDKLRWTGYCVINDGAVTSSFELGEENIASNEPDYTVPANLSVDVDANPVQPADDPIFVTLRVTVTGNAPYSYWCGGPGAYLNADVFTAKVIDSNGKTQGIKLQNGQYMMGSGSDREIKAGETAQVPASLGMLPAGIYTIQVGSGVSAKLEVKADQQLTQKREKEILAGIYQREPFSKFLAFHYHLKSVVDALQRDLTGSDLATARQAVEMFYLINPKPDGFAATIGQAMQQQLKSTDNTAAKFDFMLFLEQQAAEIRSDEMLALLLEVLASDTTNIPDRGLTVGDTNLEDVRVKAVYSLASFKQPRATEELRSLLTDSHFWIRTAAAQVLAGRKDPAGVEILRAHMHDKTALNRSDAYNALLGNFPDDPGYEALIKYGLEDSDVEMQWAAEEVQKKRDKIQALRNEK